MNGISRRGEVITVCWPNGPHDFEMVFDSLDERMPAPHAPGWLWLHGSVGQSKLMDLTIYDWRTLYARPVRDGVYEMVPKPR